MLEHLRKRNVDESTRPKFPDGSGSPVKRVLHRNRHDRADSKETSDHTHPRLIGLVYVTVGRQQKQIIYPNTLEIFRPNATRHFHDDAQPSVPIEGAPVEQNWYQLNAYDFLENGHLCEPMHPWQVDSYPNCNRFHELDLSHMRMINKG